MLEKNTEETFLKLGAGLPGEALPPILFCGTGRILSARRAPHGAIKQGCPHTPHRGLCVSYVARVSAMEYP